MNEPDCSASTPRFSMGGPELAELADNAPVMIWRARPDKVCDWFTKPWLDFVGRTLAQEFGFGWTESVHPDDVDRCIAVYEEGFEARRAFCMVYRLRRHDGEYRRLHVNAKPFAREGEFAGYFGSCVDITEQRDLEAHQKVLLAELNHRVKNNLQLIIAFLSIEIGRAKGAEAKLLLREAVGRIHGVGAIQEQLHEHIGDPIDLGEYLPNLARAILSSEAGNEVQFMVQAEPVPASFKQASTLGLIVNELVTNAVKHGQLQRSSGKLTLRIAPLDEGRAEVVLHDSGPGFDPAFLKNLAASTSQGRGLIDALARKASVSLTRTSENGAVVKLTFPVEKELELVTAPA